MRRSSMPPSPIELSHWTAYPTACDREAPLSMRGRAVFSTAVSSGTSIPCWKTNPRDWRRSWARPSLERLSTLTTRSGRPSSMLPESAERIPDRQCSRVVFPDPDGPMTATDWPAGMAMSTWSRARVVP